MEFPLVIKICVVPGFNQTALRELGYKDTYSYFAGRDLLVSDSDYKNVSSTYSWEGHTNDSRTVKEVLAKVVGYQIENIIHSVPVCDIKEHDFINIPLGYLRASMVNYPNNCRTLDLSKVSELNGKSFKQLFIVIRELRNYTIAVHFNGKTLDTGRNIKEHNLRSTGDDIILREENEKKGVHG